MVVKRLPQLFSGTLVPPFFLVCCFFHSEFGDHLGVSAYSHLTKPSCFRDCEGRYNLRRTFIVVKHAQQDQLKLANMVFLLNLFMPQITGPLQVRSNLMRRFFWFRARPMRMPSVLDTSMLDKCVDPSRRLGRYGKKGVQKCGLPFSQLCLLFVVTCSILFRDLWFISISTSTN